MHKALVRPPGEGFDAILWDDERGHVRLLDQRRLPLEAVELRCTTTEELAEAIRTLAVRGAPAIGVAAAYGVAQAALWAAGLRPGGSLEPAVGAEARDAAVQAVAKVLAATRPTAVNLFWAIERMLRRSNELAGESDAAWAHALVAEACAIHNEDAAMCRAIGLHGAALVPRGARVLTHCNAGALATGGYGTALGVIRAAHEAGKGVSVLADETRPLLQGARLTTWELMQDGIPVTLQSDGMAAFAMARGRVDLCVVGADRIAANGDVANKIGTYAVALAAARHEIPFYVAAPSSTFDLSLDSGAKIPIEQRDPEELRRFAGQASAPVGVPVWNPAFDVTPAELVTAIITERGVARAPYKESLATLLGDESSS